MKQKKYYCVYQIEHLETGKIYIGIHETYDLDDDYMGSGKYIKRAIKKYGKDAFKKTIIHVYDNETDMVNKEKELVTEEFCKRKDTYNIAPGGFGGGFKYINQNGLNLYGNNGNPQNFVRGKEMIEILKQKGTYEKYIYNLSERAKQRIKLKGHWWEGKKHKPETKLKMSKTKKLSNIQSGSNNSQYGTMWITDGRMNKKIKRVDSIPEGWYRGRNLQCLEHK